MVANRELKAVPPRAGGAENAEGGPQAESDGEGFEKDTQEDVVVGVAHKDAIGNGDGDNGDAEEPDGGEGQAERGLLLDVLGIEQKTRGFVSVSGERPPVGLAVSIHCNDRFDSNGNLC